MATEVNILNVPIAESLDNMHVLVDEQQTGEPYRIPAALFFQAATNATNAANLASDAAIAANTATTQTNAARDAANAAATNAGTATSQANAARDAANAAASAANTAAGQANTARDAANTAAGAANAAATAANSAASRTETTITNAQNATTGANTAATQANAARDAANLAAQAATDAANNVQEAIDAANRATTRATNAAILAEQATFLAPGTPMIEIRRVRSNTGVHSAIFTNETTQVFIDKLQYRVVASPEQCAALAVQGWSIGLMRPKRSNFNGDGRRWSVCDDFRVRNLRMNEYPQYSNFTYSTFDQITGIYWSGGIYIYPVRLPANYTGQWLDLPYTLEQIMRRFVHCERYTVGSGAKIKTVLNPSDVFREDFTPATTYRSIPHCIKISGRPGSQTIWGQKSGIPGGYQNMLATNKNARYITIPLAVVLCRYTSQDEGAMRMLYGTPTYFSGVMYWSGNGNTRNNLSRTAFLLRYSAKLSGSGRPEKRTIPVT